MKLSILPLILCSLITHAIDGQQNNTLHGKILFLSSGKKPAVGVAIGGTIPPVNENANTVYTTDNGAYNLVFPNARDGHQVLLKVGDKDQKGLSIEVVNEKEVEICRIPAKASDEFEIIVCPKGSRDLAAQRYYHILKTSADIALAQKEKEYNTLLNEKQKDYTKLTDLSAKLAILQKQTDSLTIYKEAFNISSINKDNASKRVLQYLQLLDEGKSIQEAREKLNIEEANKEGEESLTKISAVIEELKTRAGASEAIYDYLDALNCYNSIINFSERLEVDRLKMSQYYWKAGKIARLGGQYVKALEYQQKDINILENQQGLKPRDLAVSYNSIALTYKALGEYPKALDFQKKTLDIEKEVLDPNHSDLAASYGNIGATYRDLRNYPEAINYLDTAIALLDDSLASNYSNLTTFLNSYGLVYQDLGNFQQALSYFTDALAMSKKFLEPNHPDLAIAYGNIAVVYGYLGDFRGALDSQLQALSIQKKVFDPKHPYLAISYNNIANTYYTLEDYPKALEYHQKALAIRKEILDPKHPDLAASLNNISITYKDMKEFQNALKYGQMAVSIREEVLDPKHPDLPNSYNNLGTIYADLSNYPKALEYYQKAITIREEILGPKHPDLATSYNNIAITYFELQDYPKALVYQQKVIGIYQSALPEKHPRRQQAVNTLVEIYYALAIDAINKKDYALALQSLDTLNTYDAQSDAWNYTGFCHYSLSDYPKAIKAYLKAVTLAPETKEQQFYNNIGLAYAKNKQFKEAEAAFTEYAKLFPKEGRAYRNWAMYHALKKDRDNALQNLQKAIDLGYKDLEWLKTDTSLDNLRKDNAFIAMMEKLENKKE